MAVGDGPVRQAACFQQPLVHRRRLAEQAGQMRIGTIRAKTLPHAKAEILDSFSVRRVNQECPEPLRRNVVVGILQCVIRQACHPEVAFNGSANLGKELRERTYNGDPVQGH